MRKRLRVHDVVTELAVELRVEPVHELVHAGALFEVLRVGRRIVLVGDVFQDCRGLAQEEVTVLEHGDKAVRV